MKADEKRLDKIDNGHLTCGRNDVVCGLCVVYVVVGVNDGVITFFTAEDLDRAVCDDFICVHVCGRTCTALNRIGDKCIHKTACNDLIASRNDCIYFIGRKRADMTVYECTRFLDSCHIFNKKRMEACACNLKVTSTAERLDTIVRINGYFKVADRVVFDSHHHFFIHCLYPNLSL